jgi:hypothetical protein
MSEKAKQEPLPCISFQGQSIQLTNHAIQRFIERWPHEGTPKPGKVIALMEKFLQSAKQEEISPMLKVQRLVQHGTPTDYYVSEGWRFVITEGTLVTVERTSQGVNFDGVRMQRYQREVKKRTIKIVKPKPEVKIKVRDKRRDLKEQWDWRDGHE